MQQRRQDVGFCIAVARLVSATPTLQHHAVLHSRGVGSRHFLDCCICTVSMVCCCILSVYVVQGENEAAACYMRDPKVGSRNLIVGTTSWQLTAAASRTVSWKQHPDLDWEPHLYLRRARVPWRQRARHPRLYCACECDACHTCDPLEAERRLYQRFHMMSKSYARAGQPEAALPMTASCCREIKTAQKSCTRMVN